MNFKEELEAFQAEHPFRSMEVRGCSFQYLLCGFEDSPCCLVYFVGGTGNPLGWYRHVLAMEGKYRVLLMDYPMGEDRMEPMVALIGELLKNLGIRKAVFIGASFGGYVAQLLAKSCPEMTVGLVLYATTALTEKGIADLKKQYRYVGKLLWLIEHVPYGLLKNTMMKPMMLRLVPREKTEETRYVRDFISWICDDYTREKDLHMTRLMADIAGIPAVKGEDYAFLKNRVLLILPRHDQAFPEEMQQDLISLFPGARVKAMEGGHLATLMKAETFAEETDSFLKEIRL